MRTYFPVCVLLFAVVAPEALGDETGSPQPNIVVILADDMGYGDPQVLNPDSSLPTPNLDRLAAEGMTFTDAHTPSAVCTPTRYGLLTGRYCWRTRLTRGVLGGSSPPLIDTERTTVADLLRSAGYRTGIVGKWHLGLGFVREGDQIDFSEPLSVGPGDYGFDYSYIVPASLDMSPYVYIENHRVVELPTESQPASRFPAFWRAGVRSPGLQFEDCLDDLLAKSVEFVAAGAEEEDPFFLYFPLTAPHKPVSPHERFVGSTELGPYGDFITQVDWTVGQLLNALDEAGVAEDTLVLFTSDNGSFMYRLDEADATDHVDDATVQAFRGDRHRANHMLRGTKADIWEAGHRVPFFVRWPAAVEAASTCDTTVCLTDVLATCAEIVSAEVDSDTGEDSYSMLPLLLGDSPAEPRPPVVHHSAAGMFAIRDGQWKLVLGNGSGGRQQPRGQAFGEPFQLYDLSSDIGEQTDVADKHPEIVERLTEQLEAIRGN